MTSLKGEGMRAHELYHSVAQLLIQGRIDAPEERSSGTFVRGLYLEQRESIYRAVQRAADESPDPWQAMSVLFYIKPNPQSSEEHVIEKWTFSKAGNPKLPLRQTSLIFRAIHLHLRLAPIYGHKIKAVTPLPLGYRVQHNPVHPTDSSPPKHFRRLQLFGAGSGHDRVVVNFDYLADVTPILQMLPSSQPTVTLSTLVNESDPPTSSRRRADRVKKLQDVRSRTQTWSSPGDHKSADMFRARERIRKSREEARSASGSPAIAEHSRSESSNPIAIPGSASRRTRSQAVSLPAQEMRSTGQESGSDAAVFHPYEPSSQGSSAAVAPETDDRRRSLSFGLRMPSLDSSDGSYPPSALRLQQTRAQELHRVETWTGSLRDQVRARTSSMRGTGAASPWGQGGSTDHSAPPPERVYSTSVPDRRLHVPPGYRERFVSTTAAGYRSPSFGRNSRAYGRSVSPESLISPLDSRGGSSERSLANSPAPMSSADAQTRGNARAGGAEGAANTPRSRQLDISIDQLELGTSPSLQNSHIPSPLADLRLSDHESDSEALPGDAAFEVLKTPSDELDTYPDDDLFFAMELPADADTHQSKSSLQHSSLPPSHADNKDAEAIDDETHFSMFMSTLESASSMKLFKGNRQDMVQSLYDIGRNVRDVKNEMAIFGESLDTS